MCKETRQNSEKIDMIWGSRSCSRFMEMMLDASRKEEITARS